MTGLRISEWRKLPVSLAELCIDTTLRCGQSFRWRKYDDEWQCVLHGRIVSLKQDSDALHYRSIWPDAKSGLPLSSSDDTESLLRHYFNLKPNLTKLYEQWSLADPNFRKRAPKFTGIRILKQDAWEALIGFICSSNNNISRISQMVSNLCLHYGPLIGIFESRPFHDFPAPEALAGKGVETKLRDLGFGYRAKFIAETARIIAKEKPSGWLDSLSNPDSSALEDASLAVEGPGRPGYREAHEQLLQLQGVGPKVADCVCLMGLGWGEAVPVDTHVWQIAQRDYRFGKGKHKSLTKPTYDAVGHHFRELWGKEAGWAQSVLFTANLRSFADQASQKLEVDLVEVKREDGGVIESKVAVKRQLDIDGEIVKSEEALEVIKVESDRSKRAKRRRTVA